MNREVKKKLIEDVGTLIGFCGECEHLSITEFLQDKLNPKPPHICNKYKRILVHGVLHPHLPRLAECKQEEQEVK